VTSPCVARALERACSAAAAEPSSEPRAPIARRRRLALGDPQAPLAVVLEILDRHGALGSDGWLAPDTHLVSLGDHFDWGEPGERERAARSGLRLLAWLAAHPPDQVTLILGNHDLGRVCELARFDDAGFARAQAEADTLYHPDGEGDPAAERAFLARHPDLPSVEVAARDLGTFRVDQRRLVAALLRARRFCAASAAGPRLLLCHAGLTRSELERLGIEEREPEASAVAAALNTRLDAAVAEWDGTTPLAIDIFHLPGSARIGEGRGMFSHRPAHPARARAEHFAGPPRRRFDPREAPPGLVQVIGHAGDAKCRELLAPWVDGLPAGDGPLRHLETDGRAARYARGVPARVDAKAAVLLFLDGRMALADPSGYELLDLDTLQPAARLD